jgi:hypothetical protein
MTELSVRQIAVALTGRPYDPVAELRLLSLFRSEPPDHGEVESEAMQPYAELRQSNGPRKLAGVA